jgi:hypothetical protein
VHAHGRAPRLTEAWDSAGPNRRAWWSDSVPAGAAVGRRAEWSTEARKSILE